ncbi:MAG: ATP-binding protein [Acetobacteraceae bacterium]
MPAATDPAGPSGRLGVDHARGGDAAAGLEGEFAAAMAALGPFAPRPRLAAAVSGGADSLALALLAAGWAAARGGSVLALLVDHGLRPESAAEAAQTAARLAGRAITARILTLRGLTPGPALAERARAARYRALAEAAAEAAIAEVAALISSLGGSSIPGEPAP